MCVLLEWQAPQKWSDSAFVQVWVHLKTYKGFDVADYIFEIYIQNTVSIVICRGLRLLLQDW